MDEREPINRLTEREKQVLHAWLGHTTAKEIALDMGISYHAVEKRLKMAGTKLGVDTSLKAARILADCEGPGLTVAQSPDLDSPDQKPREWFEKPMVFGLLALSMIAATALTLVLQGAEGAEPSVDGNEADKFVQASPERVEAYVRKEFDTWDRDRSSFIELAEAPGQVFGPNSTRHEGNEAREFSVTNFDKDGDGRVSFVELAEKVSPQFLEQGIPLVPADQIDPRHIDSQNS